MQYKKEIGETGRVIYQTAMTPDATPLVASQMSKALTVVIPSRTQPRQAEFLRQAVRSVNAQTVRSAMTVKVVVCIDRGAILSTSLIEELAVLVRESHGNTQAAALNVGLRAVDTDLVAILEDDDQWHPKFFEYAQRVLSAGAGFVSSTQLEVNQQNEIVRINDFPTPSGWLMPTSTMRAVGEFNESHRWHLDSEWLGRLAELNILRVHLVEATAPVHYELMKQVRPWLANVIRFGGPQSRIARHELLFPLVRRLVHSGSGVEQIGKNSNAAAQSQQEIKTLAERFKHLPW